MGSPEAEGIVRAAYKAFARGDIDAMMALAHPDLVWHETGRHVFAGEMKGQEEVVERLRAGLNLLDEFTIEIVDVIESEGRVTALVHWSATAGSETIDVKTVHMHVVRDGLIAESFLTPIDESAVDAFWNGITGRP